MPMPTGTEEEKIAFRQQLLGELPAVHYFLDHEWRVPKQILDSRQRFPCRTWQHPQIVGLLMGQSRPMQFREIVYRVLFDRFWRSNSAKTPWEGTSSELLEQLETSDLKATAARLTQNSVQVVGELLGQWRNIYPEEVQGPKRQNRAHYYWIVAAPPAGGKAEASVG